MAFNDMARLTTETYLIPSSEGTAYTTPSGKTAELCSILYHNNHSSAVSVYVYMPVSSGSGAIGNCRDYFTLNTGETYLFEPKVPVCMPADTFVRCSASVDAQVSMMITGREQV